MRSIKIVHADDEIVVKSSKRLIKFIDGNPLIETYCGDYDGHGCGEYIGFLTLENHKSFYASTCVKCVKEQKGW